MDTVDVANTLLHLAGQLTIGEEGKKIRVTRYLVQITRLFFKPILIFHSLVLGDLSFKDHVTFSFSN